MFAQLVKDLVHFERGENGFDQHGGADGPARNADMLLRIQEDVVPQPRFQMTLHFRQIKIRAGSLGEQRFGIVEEVQAEIHQRAGDRSAVHLQMPLDQMPAAGANQQHRRLRAERVLFSFGTLITNVSPDGVASDSLGRR